MINELKNILTQKIPEELVLDLLSSYSNIIKHYRKNDFSEVAGKSGRFAENVYRILFYLDKNIVLKEVKDMDKIDISIQNNMKYSESIRILIPRVSRSVIYTFRSKTDSVHVKEKIAEEMDAILIITAVNWVVSEMIRELSENKEDRIFELIKQIMKKDPSLLQTFEGQKLILKKFTAEIEILIFLFYSSRGGVSRTEIGKSLEYAPSSISTALNKLLRERKIFITDSKRYHITDNGERIVSDLIDKLPL